jgi:lipopolysaccharide/colanic/teichoic acid biosynthesis glycosyltransferase
MSILTESCLASDPDDGMATPPAAGWYPLCKVALDAIGALALLILLAPWIALLMALTRLTSRGPAIYRQERVGLHGRQFTIYKIRTMVRDAERGTGPKWSTPDDPRVTPLGRFLRRTHLDELPQLWNIVRGEMSLVGPRPERPELVAPFELAIPRYSDRLLVRPGLTGLAQVQLPPDTDLVSVRRKLACDLYYIQRVSLWLDLRILLSTASHVVGIPFSVPRALLRVPSGEAVEEAYRRVAAPPSPQVQPA